MDDGLTGLFDKTVPFPDEEKNKNSKRKFDSGERKRLQAESNATRIYREHPVIKEWEEEKITTLLTATRIR